MADMSDDPKDLLNYYFEINKKILMQYLALDFQKIVSY